MVHLVETCDSCSPELSPTPGIRFIFKKKKIWGWGRGQSLTQAYSESDTYDTTRFTDTGFQGRLHFFLV